MSHWKIGVKILCVVLKRGSIFYGSLKNRGQNSRARYMQVPRSREPQWGAPMGPGGYACTAHRVYSKMLVRQWKLKWKKQGSKFYVAKAGRVKILWKLKYGGQNSIFFSWNPWSKFYVPWKGGSKFYIFSQCLEKGGSKPRSLPTNFTEGVPPPPPPPGFQLLGISPGL